MRLGRPLNLSDAPEPPGLLLPPGDGRGPVPRLPRRAAAARRARRSACWWCRTAPPRLRRGRGRGPADHRHGAGRDGRRRRGARSRRAEGRRDRAAAVRAAEGPEAGRRPGAGRRGAARGAGGRGPAAVSDDPAAEEARLQAAIGELQAQIDEMLEGHQAVLGPSYDLLETYKMLAHSRSWNHSLLEAVRSGLTAEAAVERVRSEHRAGIGQARDPYLRERVARPGGPQRPAAAPPGRRWQARRGCCPRTPS